VKRDVNRRYELVCVRCKAVYPGDEPRNRCDCGGTLDVVHDLEMLKGRIDKRVLDERMGSLMPWDVSGVWRFRELVAPLSCDKIFTRPEGNTGLYISGRLSLFTGIDNLRLKQEGENPTGSFKDRGMTVGITMARFFGMKTVACASTGNTAASMAAYAAMAGMRAVVFVPAGKIALGKLAQALAYGARTIQIEADFDSAMHLVEQVCRKRNIYLLNSLNPFRIEGQKAIGFEILQQMRWNVPDWIVVPGGNLGNNSALSKGFMELKELGLIDKLPKIAVVQAEGANPLYTAFREKRDLVPVQNPDTVATAIRIGNPVSWRKSLRGIEATGGVVEQLTDDEILQAKIEVDASGIGAEPASCASVGGARKLVKKGTIRPGSNVVCVLTGNLLKDPDTVIAVHKGSLGKNIQGRNQPVKVEPRLDAVLQELDN